MPSVLLHYCGNDNTSLISNMGYPCSLNWQHQLCKNPRPNPDIKTLFQDHTCAPPNGPLAVAPTPVNLPVAAVAKPAAYTSLGAHGVWYTASQSLVF